MLRRQCPKAIEREVELDGHRPFGPQRAVIVEHRDAVGGRHEIGVAWRRHARDEIQDRLLGGAVVPCGQGGIAGLWVHAAYAQRSSIRAAVPNGPSW